MLTKSSYVCFFLSPGLINKEKVKRKSTNSLEAPFNLIDNILFNLGDIKDLEEKSGDTFWKP